MNIKDFAKTALQTVKDGKAALSKNSLSDDERAVVAEQVAALERLIKEADNIDTEVSIAEDVTKAVAEATRAIEEKINILNEKITDRETMTETTTREEYLQSENAVKDFARLLRTHHTAAEFARAWKSEMSRNGITVAGGDEDILLPVAIKGRIEDNWNADSNWLRYLNNTGAKRYMYRYTDQSQDDTDVRAKGHKRGSKDTKTEQDLILQKKIAELQSIYKLQSLDEVAVFEDDAELIRYIGDEMSKQVYYEIGRAILIGDGRSGNDQITTFEGISRATTDAFANVYATAFSGNVIEEYMTNLIAPVWDGSDLILFTNKNDLFALRKQLFASGGTERYASIDELKGMMGVRDIVVLPYFNDTNSGETRAIALHPDKYITVGQMDNFNFLRFPDHLTNTEYFRCETHAGGLLGLNGASVILNA